MNLIPKLLLAVFTCFATSLFAQTSFTYTPFHDNETSKKTLTDATKKRYESDIASLTGNNKKYIADVYKDRYEYVEKYYTDNVIITDARAEKYLQSVLAEIVNNNSAIKNLEVRVLFSRAWWPNAFSLGEGTIIFNIGLFNRLQNESQVAFVLSHELSHQYLDHGNRHILNYINTVYSDTFQHKLKQIKNTEYNKRQLLEQTVSGISFSSRRHGREHEAEADSIALEFLKNTHYNVNGAISCLALLDSVDNDKYNVPPKPDSFFNSPAYPFQQAWVKKESSFSAQLAASTLQEKEETLDSLKTHPDCKLRIEKLKGSIAVDFHTDSKDFIVADSDAFHQLQQSFDFEIVNYAYNSNNLSRSLYYSMQMLQAYPNHTYLITNIGRCFNKMYEAQKTHVLGTMVDAPSPYAEQKYNAFVLFLQRLRLTDVAAINYNFLMPFAGKFHTDKSFAEVYAKSKQLFNN